ncbi:uncharacterized protein LOC110732258 [Chenopodium quinoa]|uniref:uncharacterized protein LOC110732258 n=1 Tax=Chenopodium quinoa TaxID=63459 RepID=UPI000B7909C2|nr:uncharacterized protein LOC110732258 [Chenopodium quinoa]
MGDLKKWSVTYTKHVKQKRKVYQDGSLHLLSNNKVVLYDEGEQLLDSKFLTKDEAVKSGESLTFSSFLVDIGDPENNCNPISNPKPKYERDVKPHERTQMPQGEKLRHTFTGRKPNTAGRKNTTVCLSPSQKIIREFKKNEVLKYGAHSPTSPVTPSAKEWEALYTTQLTQKAKKYHDGFIRMIICGSQGRQIMLYDCSKNQIDHRFLNKDEVINSGGSLTFDAHLVDIGDPVGTSGDDADVKIKGRNSISTEKSEILSGRQWQKPFSADFSASKAKRSKESTLMDQVGSGDSVGIGKPRNIKHVNSSARRIGFDEIKQKNTASHPPIRDANQILSIMRKPMTQETLSTVNDAPVLVQLHDDSQPSQTFDNSLPVDRCQVIEADQAVEKHNNEKAAAGGDSSTFSEGNCSNLERPDSTEGTEIIRSNAYESPRKNKSAAESSVVDERPAVLQSSKGK